MPNCKCSYEPLEDSTLLEKHVRQHAFGRVLDMGTGSGIQAIAAAQSPKVDSVLAVDIQKETINYCAQAIKNRKIKFLQSDLFGSIKGKFDTIIFNPPYLPADVRIKDAALDGGKHGYEIIERFLGQANDFLNNDGMILILFSSLTKKEKVDGIIGQTLLQSVELERMSLFFEQLFVYMLKKDEVLRKIEAKKISNARYMAKGHRGLIFLGTLGKDKVVIKIKNPRSLAKDRIANESRWLKTLNRRGIGPKLIDSSEDFFVYRYIEGDFIVDFLENSGRIKIKETIKKIFMQMYLLDKMGVDKEEMHHPTKHVIISKNKPYLIDFERMHASKSPKNVTQFCQFITRGNITKILKAKGFAIDEGKIRDLAKIYKRNRTLANLQRIFDEL